jgi:hypothetical protein
MMRFPSTAVTNKEKIMATADLKDKYANNDAPGN